MDTTNHAIELAKAEYWSKGYAVLRAIFADQDILRWREECERLWSLPGLLDDLNLRSESRRDVAGTYVADRLDPVLDISPPLFDAALDARLFRPLQVILNGRVALLKCKLIRKDPGTGGYMHHQDYLYWRWLEMPADGLCSVAIPLYRSDAESGGIEFFPGYHKTLLPGLDGDSNADFDLSHIDVTQGETPALEPGDVLVFHALTPHRSPPNASQRPRTLLLPSYANSSRHDLYGRYYEREIRRRCAEHVGFERYSASLADLSVKHQRALHRARLD